MRIALIHYRLARKGGLETRLYNYAEWFTKAGHEVTIIYASQRGESELSAEVKTIKVSVGIAPKSFRRIVFSNHVERILKTQTFDFSLSLGRTVGQDAVLAAANHRGFLEALGKNKNSLSDWSQDRMDMLAFQKTPVIFAASEMMKSELVNLYNINPEKIHILFPPIQLRNFQAKTLEGKATLKAKFGISPNKISCCFVSTSHQRKGFDILLKVFEKLDPNQFELLVAGSPFKSKLSNVRSLGFLSDPSDLYAAADYCLHPARFEPFGQVITESLQSGTPVIVSHKVGAKEIITPEVGKIIPSLDWKDWHEVIHQLEKGSLSVPNDYIKKQELGLDAHMTRMLSIMNQK